MYRDVIRRWKRDKHPTARPLTNRAIALGAVVVLGIGAAAFTVLLWRYGGLDAIRTASTVTVAAGGAVALLLAARRQQSTERALEHERESAAEQYITELYTRAVDQLGAEKAPVRLGGDRGGGTRRAGAPPHSYHPDHNASGSPGSPRPGMAAGAFRTSSYGVVFVPGERCVIRTRRHWLVPLRDITRGGGMMAVVGVLTFLAPQVFLVQLALWLGAIAHTAYIGWCVLRWRAEQVAVTDRRIIRVSGILTRTVDAAPLAQITDTTLRRSIPGRILGYGSIRIETAGKKQSVERIDFVPRPDAIYRATLP